MATKPKLSAEELIEKKQRDNLQHTCNRIRSAWSWGKIKIYKDILLQAGYPEEYILATYFPSELNRSVVYEDVKEFLDDRRIEIETAIWLKHNPPIILPELNDNLIPAPIIQQSKDEQEEERNRNKDYGFIKSPNEPPFLFVYWFQKKAIKELMDKTLKEMKRGVTLVAGTGTGKTFICAAFFRRLLDAQYHIGKTLTPWPYICVTKASVVEQTKRVFKQYFNIDPENDVLVINIDQLRSKFGELFVKEEVTIVRGEESYKWVWRNNIFPIVIWWDECQALKNTDSQQSQIAQSYNEIPSPHTIQVFASATPGTRVAEFKCFAVSTRIPYTYGFAKNVPLINSHWTDFADNIASDNGRLDIKPIDHSPGAVDRLMNKLADYIVRVKGVKSQFHALNRVAIIDFETPEGKQFYDNAWERFLAKKAKLEGNDMMSVAEIRMNILASLTIFRIAAESNPDRVRKIARDMYRYVQEGYASVASLNFKISIIQIVQTLVNDFHVPRNKISLIWGGAPKPKTKQEKLKAIMKDKGAEAFDDLESLIDELEDEEEQKLDPALRLGMQSRIERQKEIDKFQRGDSLYCLYTFRAGGVGLSLHHSDELTKEKVRHKESGYAFEEDIPKIPTRPRINFVAPTYSAIELVQGLGRCPRLTSLSDTVQELQFYRGTIEERVAYVVSMKLRCLTKVVRNKESWEDVIVGNYTDEQIEAKHLTGQPIKEDADEGSPGDGYFEEDEE